MTSLQRQACLIGLTGALVLSTSGCDPYTYFNVHVAIDPAMDTDSQVIKDARTRRQIDACVVYVFADGQQIEEGKNLKTRNGIAEACQAPNTPLNVGILDYSTTRSSGKLKFTVAMKNLDSDVIAQGSTQEAAVNPGSVYPGTLEVLATPCGGSKPACEAISRP